MSKYLSTTLAAALACSFAATAIAQDRTPPPVDPLQSTTDAMNVEKADFRTLDVDQDGFVSETEVVAEASLAAYFTNYDKDADGKLSKQEYRSYLKDSAANTTEPGLDPATRY